MNIPEEIPLYLHHRVLGMSEVNADTIRDFVKVIKMYGLMPQVPHEWKSRLPERLQTEPVVWLSEGIYQGFETGRILLIDTALLADEKLHCIDAFVKGWWIYEGLIPPEAIWVLEKEANQ